MLVQLHLACLEADQFKKEINKLFITSMPTVVVVCFSIFSVPAMIANPWPNQDINSLVCQS